MIHGHDYARVKWTAPAALLAVAWCLLYVLGIGVALALMVWVQKGVSENPSVAVLDKQDIRDTIAIVSLFVLVASLWRFSICLASDIRKAIEKKGGIFHVSGRKGAGQVSGVSVEIKFDRPFLDYWPHPRGTQREIICGEEVNRRLGAYQPGYMRRMSVIKLSIECHARERILLCSGRSIPNDNGDAWKGRAAEFDRSFGSNPGDWEVEMTHHRLRVNFRSGSWDGSEFVRKLNFGIDKIVALRNDYDPAEPRCEA